MRETGGYFGLELQKGKQTFHSGTTFKSGRSALHFILQYTQPQNVYIPFYTCNALLEPFAVAGVPYTFYPINEYLDPVGLPELQQGEYFLYVNYFDLKRETVQPLSQKYGDRLIIDCSQAFFYTSSGLSWCFNSCRKFFGVPDGAYLYAPGKLGISTPAEKNTNFLIDHLLQRFTGNTEEGYSAFVKNEALCNSEIRGMSVLSEHLLSHVDFDACRQKRKENFLFLHRHLNAGNSFKIQFQEDSVPMYYPLLPKGAIKHEQLWKENLFVPVLWKDVLNREVDNYTTEKYLSQNLLPLPVDHRYSLDDMQLIVQLIKEI